MNTIARRALRSALVAGGLLAAVTDDAQQTLDAIAAVDVPAAVETVTGAEALVDDAVEDGALDAVTEAVSDVAAGADEALGTDPVLESTVDAVTGPDGVADDVLGADAPSGGTSDALVEEVVEDLDTTASDLLAGDLPAVNDDLTGEDGLVDDAVEDGAPDSLVSRVTDVAGAADDTLGTGGSLEGFVEVIAGQEGWLDDLLGADLPTTGTSDELLEYVVADLNQITGDAIDLRVGSMIGGVVLDEGLFDDLFENQVTVTVPEPGDGTTDPGDGTTDPGDGTTDPGDGTTDPGAGTTDPGDGTTDPGDGTTDPGDGTTPPGTGTTPPGDGSTGPLAPGSGLGGSRPSASASAGGIRLPAALVALVSAGLADRAGTAAATATATATDVTRVAAVVQALPRTGADDADLLVVAGLLLALGAVSTTARRRWERTRA